MREVVDKLAVTEAALARAKHVFKTMRPGVDVDAIICGRAPSTVDPDGIDPVLLESASFANSAGGQIVFGVTEDKRLPIQVDEGFDESDISKEWIEMVIDTNVSPRIEGLVIRVIPLETGRVIYVIEIP